MVYRGIKVWSFLARSVLEGTTYGSECPAILAGNFRVSVHKDVDFQAEYHEDEDDLGEVDAQLEGRDPVRVNAVQRDHGGGRLSGKRLRRSHGVSTGARRWRVVGSTDSRGVVALQRPVDSKVTI